MHYYSFDISDYYIKAGRLTMLEHGAYRLLIDACYDRERFPTSDLEAIEWCLARTEQEEAAVRYVFSKFFHLENGEYTQDRINNELQQYHNTCSKNKAIAKSREEKKKNGARLVNDPCTTGERPVHDQSTVGHPTINYELLTSNEEQNILVLNIEDLKPIKLKKKDIGARVENAPPNVSPQTWQDFVVHRKAKKAPITKTVIDAIEREAGKCGFSLDQALQECVLRGWQGFKADWVLNSGRQSPSSTARPYGLNKQEILEAQNRIIAEEAMAEHRARMGEANASA